MLTEERLQTLAIVDLVLEMTPHPLFQSVRGPVHVQGQTVAVQDLVHIVISPQSEPMLARSIVRICVDDVGNWSFLRDSLRNSIAENRAVKDAS